MRTHRSFLPALLTVLALAGCPGDEGATPHAHADDPAHTKAVCVLNPTEGSQVRGVVHFTQKDGYILVQAEVTGLTPGKHGFHVHEFGDVTASNGTSAGGHFNPQGHDHSLPNGAKRHIGDLGNVEADASGKATYEAQNKLIQFAGPHSILGRGMVVHAGEDDGGQPTGNAGARAAVGVIGIAKAE